MFNFIEEFKKIEDNNGVQLCLCEIIEQGFTELIMYQVVADKERRRIFWSEEIQNEIKRILAKEYWGKSQDKILAMLSFRFFKQFPIIFSTEGLVFKKVYKENRVWRIHNVNGFFLD